MKLPPSILSHLRGPIVAATLAGCTPAPVEPAPAAPIEPVVEPEPVGMPDPVAYDADLERERLARLDRERAADEHRRERRIQDAEPRILFGQIGPGRWIHPACGRG